MRGTLDGPLIRSDDTFRSRVWRSNHRSLHNGKKSIVHIHTRRTATSENDTLCNRMKSALHLRVQRHTYVVRLPESSGETVCYVHQSNIIWLATGCLFFHHRTVETKSGISLFQQSLHDVDYYTIIDIFINHDYCWTVENGTHACYLRKVDCFTFLSCCCPFNERIATAKVNMYTKHPHHIKIALSRLANRTNKC